MPHHTIHPTLLHRMQTLVSIAEEGSILQALKPEAPSLQYYRQSPGHKLTARLSFTAGSGVEAPSCPHQWVHDGLMAYLIY